MVDEPHKVADEFRSDEQAPEAPNPESEPHAEDLPEEAQGLPAKEMGADTGAGDPEPMRPSSEEATLGEGSLPHGEAPAVPPAGDEPVISPPIDHIREAAGTEEAPTPGAPVGEAPAQEAAGEGLGPEDEVSRPGFSTEMEPLTTPADEDFSDVPAPVAGAGKEAEESAPKGGVPGEIQMDWYILKVQSNREKSIAQALKRKIAIEGLNEYFDDALVPMEKVTEFKGGKKKIVERKLYPGYIVVHMCINDDTWFAVRETSGIGDFTGSGGKPTPMLPHEVARIVHTEEEETTEAPKLNITFKIGDRVKIKEGTFESFEGEVNEIDEQSGRITVMINIFGRSTPVELEYWQAETV